MPGDREHEFAAPETLESSPRGVRLVGLALGPLFALGLLFAPGLELEPVQRRVAAVAALTATYWITEAIPLAAASLLPAALLPLFGALPAERVAPPYMDDLVMLFLGAFLLALGLERWGVHKRMALAILATVGPRPERLVLGFLAATVCLSLWMNNTATALLMLPIGLSVAARVESGSNPRAARDFQVALILAIAYGATFGGLGTPVGTAPNQVFLGHFARMFPEAPPIDFGAWVLGWLPLVVVLSLVGWWLLSRGLLRVRGAALGAREAILAERRALGRPSRGEVWMAAVFGATALLWLTRGDLDLGFATVPGWSRGLFALVGEPGADFAAHRRFVTDGTVALAMAVVCFVVPVDRARGVHLLDWSVAKRVPWDVLLLIGGGFSLAEAFRASGLDRVIGESLAPLFAGASEWVVVLVLVTLVVFLSEITSNTATANVFVPVFAQAAVAAGWHPLAIMAPIAIASSGGFMLPVSTPPNALAYSTRRVPLATMVRVGFVLNLVLAVLITVCFELWVRRLWHVGAELPEWARTGGAAAGVPLGQ
ncbi:MAG: anion permease [Planctomycetes bacterium]|nr:anion permease [Planctomycetota bacterium]